MKVLLGAAIVLGFAFAAWAVAMTILSKQTLDAADEASSLDPDAASRSSGASSAVGWFGGAPIAALSLVVVGLGAAEVVRQKKKAQTKTAASLLINAMTGHVDTRVNKLYEMLRGDDEVRVVIAGKGEVPQIGKGYARGQWIQKLTSLGVGKTEAEEIQKAFEASLDQKFNKLREAMPERVTFGQVGGKSLSKKQVHVWGANSENWNLPEGTRIPGDGQAEDIGIQRKGSFGIISTPVLGPPPISAR